MTEESCHRIVAGKWGEATGLSCLIRVVWREKKKKSLGSAASERRVTDRVGGQSGWYDTCEIGQ